MRETRDGAGNLKTSKNISDSSRVYRDAMSSSSESGNWASRTDLKPQHAVVGAEDEGCPVPAVPVRNVEAAQCQSVLLRSRAWGKLEKQPLRALEEYGNTRRVGQALSEWGDAMGCPIGRLWLKYLVLEYCQLSAPGTCEARKRDVGRGECRHNLHRNVAGIWKGA